MAGGGPLGQTASAASSNPLGPQQGQSAPAVGGTMGQMPSFTNSPFGMSQQSMGGQMRSPMPSYGGFGGQMPGFAQNDNMARLGQILKGSSGPTGEAPSGFNQQQTPQPLGQPFGMQNPFQPPQPAFMQDPEFQGYDTQMKDLHRQMQDYVEKAPMYQQIQDLQKKMSGFQQRYNQQAMPQQAFPTPQPQYEQQQLAGLQSLLGMLGGMGSRSRPAITPPQGMEARRGHGGTYFVPRGTPYYPGMG